MVAVLAEIVTASSSSGSPAVLIIVNLALFALAVGVIILLLRARRKRRTTLDPAFQGAPVGHGVVTDLQYMYRKVNETPLYRITYHVHTRQGQQFFGWEEKYLLRISEKPQFDVGTNHLVAYRPGTDQVRALPPRR